MKKYIAIGLVLAIMAIGAGCGKQEPIAEETTLETITEETSATAEETVMTNEQGQMLDENGNVIETQVSTDESGNTVVVDNSGNKIEKNASGGVVRKTTAGKAKTAQQPVANNNKGTKAAPATKAPATQAQAQQPQTTRATTKATTRATTKAKAKTTVASKQQGYYVCNGCRYKVLSSGNGWDKMDAHIEKQMLAGNFKCSGYHTAWM